VIIDEIEVIVNRLLVYGLILSLSVIGIQTENKQTSPRVPTVGQKMLKLA
jgi:hypothetical protein